MVRQIQGPTSVVGFVVAIDLKSIIISYGLHVEQPTGAWPVLFDIHTVKTRVTLRHTQRNVFWRLKFGFFIFHGEPGIKGLLLIALGAAFFDVASGEDHFGVSDPSLSLIQIEHSPHGVDLAHIFEVFIHQIAAIQAKNLFTSFNFIILYYAFLKSKLGGYLF